MPNEPADTVFVDPNTDDLDAFSALLDGGAKVKTEEDVVKTESVNEEADESSEADVEDTSAPDVTPEDGETQEEEEPDTKPKKIGRFQERINQLTSRAQEAERAYKALQDQLANTNSTPEDQTAASAVQGQEPTPEDRNPDGTDKYPLGEFDPQYIRDMARHTIAKEWSTLKEQEAVATSERQEQEARNALHEQWVDKLSPVVEKYDDYLDKTIELETVFAGLDPQYSDYLVQTIKSLDHGPEVLYYFANNLEEAREFVSAGVLRATLALGEVNSRFKNQAAKPEQKVSKAPPPPQTNKGSRTRQGFSPDTDNLEAFSEEFFKRPS